MRAEKVDRSLKSFALVKQAAGINNIKKDGKFYNNARMKYVESQIARKKMGWKYRMPTNGERDEDVIMFTDNPVPAQQAMEHTYRLGDISIEEFLAMEDSDKGKEAFMQIAFERSEDSVNLFNYLHGGIDGDDGETRDAVPGDMVSVAIGKTEYELYDGCRIPVIDDLDIMYGEIAEERMDACHHLYDDRYQAMRDNEYEACWDRDLRLFEEREENERAQHNVPCKYSPLPATAWEEIEEGVA